MYSSATIIISYFILKGLKRELASQNGDTDDCVNNFLQTSIELNLPMMYSKNVFCAVNPSKDESTCPGDSGKNAFHLALL